MPNSLLFSVHKISSVIWTGMPIIDKETGMHHFSRRCQREANYNKWSLCSIKWMLRNPAERKTKGVGWLKSVNRSIKKKNCHHERKWDKMVLWGKTTWKMWYGYKIALYCLKKECMISPFKFSIKDLVYTYRKHKEYFTNLNWHLVINISLHTYVHCHLAPKLTDNHIIPLHC
jgi:hypothetical protein